MMRAVRRVHWQVESIFFPPHTLTEFNEEAGKERDVEE